MKDKVWKEGGATFALTKDGREVRLGAAIPTTYGFRYAVVTNRRTLRSIAVNILKALEEKEGR